MRGMAKVFKSCDASWDMIGILGLPIEVAFYLDEDRVCAYTDFSKQRWRDWRTPTHVGSR